ncbi:hypothetical protein [Pyrobaculum aerophilum]|uniref:hypothetical protein n=1 Tax=Pyrobaculum aerophilum TaxID=13773 RepID=UPI0023F00771|nr:hypothetical protein [Pyrobaculum aerophilum]MCX8137201.1 hypothetical protein [Pyrobaculum aerophilum]
MEIDYAGLKHFGVDGEPIGADRVGEFLKIPGVVVDELAPGQHVDFVTLRVRHEKRRGLLRQVAPRLRRAVTA